MEAPTLTLAQELREKNTVEIPIPGSERKARFKRLSLWDLAAAGLIPVEIFSRSQLTDAQKQKLIEDHTERLLKRPDLAEFEAGAIEKVLVAVSIEPKIVPSTTKDTAPDEIRFNELGNTARYFYLMLAQACGVSDAAPEVKQAAPFREEVRSNAGRGGAKVRRAPKRASSKRGVPCAS